MTEQKTTTPTAPQTVLACLKLRDADAAKALLELLDARYVRLTASDGASLAVPHFDGFPVVPVGESLTNGIAVDTAPAIAQVAAEVNGVGKQHAKAPWNQWTLEQLKSYIDRDGYAPSMHHLRSISGMCPTTLDEVERRSHGAAYTLLVDEMLAEVAGTAVAETAKAEVKPRWDRPTLEEFLKRYPNTGSTASLAAEMSRTIYDDVTLDEIARRFRANGEDHARDMLTERPEDTGLLTALLTQLDEVWGHDNLVDINVEQPEHYALVLAELIAMAKRCKSYEARQPIATDQWVNGLHKPMLEAVGDILRKRATELYAELGQLLQCMSSPSQIRPDAYAAKYLASRNSLDEIWRTQLGIEGELVRGGTGSRS